MQLKGGNETEGSEASGGGKTGLVDCLKKKHVNFD